MCVRVPVFACLSARPFICGGGGGGGGGVCVCVCVSPSVCAWCVCVSVFLFVHLHLCVCLTVRVCPAAVCRESTPKECSNNNNRMATRSQLAFKIRQCNEASYPKFHFPVEMIQG